MCLRLWEPLGSFRSSGRVRRTRQGVDKAETGYWGRGLLGRQSDLARVPTPEVRWAVVCGVVLGADRGCGREKIVGEDAEQWPWDDRRGIRSDE